MRRYGYQKSWNAVRVFQGPTTRAINRMVRVNPVETTFHVKAVSNERRIWEKIPYALGGNQ